MANIFNPRSETAPIDNPKQCSMCYLTAWYMTGEPALKEPIRYFCGEHRPQARARQRSIWGHSGAVLPEDKIWSLTNHERSATVFPYPNNPIAQEEPESA